MKVTATLKTILWIAGFIAVLLIALSSYTSIRIYKHLNPRIAYTDTLKLVGKSPDIIIKSQGIEKPDLEFNITIQEVPEKENIADSTIFSLKGDNYSGSLKVYYSSLKRFGYDLNMNITPEEVIIEKPYEKITYIKQENKIRFFSLYVGFGSAFNQSKELGKFRISGARIDFGLSLYRKLLIFISIDTNETFWLNSGYIF